MPKVLSGKDIVLAAETGSGKTLAYIAPLSSLLLQRAASGHQPPSPDTFADSSSSRARSSSSGSSSKLPSRYVCDYMATTCQGPVVDQYTHPGHNLLGSYSVHAEHLPPPHSWLADSHAMTSSYGLWQLHVSRLYSSP